MTSYTPDSSPSDAVPQLRWLGRPCRHQRDLLGDFARTPDDQDWQGHAANDAPDGVLAISSTTAHTGRESLAEFVAAGLRVAGTHHVSTIYAITIDGDTATTARTSSPPMSWTPPTPTSHADGAGWYRCAMRRTPGGRRFTHVTLEIGCVSAEALVNDVDAEALAASPAPPSQAR